MRLFCSLFLLAATFLTLITTLAAQERSAPFRPPDVWPIKQNLTRSADSLRILCSWMLWSRHAMGIRSKAWGHVFENGKEQTIKVFEEHSPGMDEPRKEPPALPPVTYISMFLSLRMTD